MKYEGLEVTIRRLENEIRHTAIIFYETKDEQSLLFKTVNLIFKKPPQNNLLWA
jgi:hypothetical protein